MFQILESFLLIKKGKKIEIWGRIFFNFILFFLEETKEKT